MTSRIPKLSAGAGAAVLVLTLSVAACGASSPSRQGSGPQANPPAAGSPRQGTAQLASATSSASTASAAGSAASASAAHQATITTQGVGTVSGAPDTMTLGIGVSTTAGHAATALAENNLIASRVQQALKVAGVPLTDIQTAGLSLEPTSPNPGFQVYDEVTATVKNIARAGTIIDDALAPAGDAGRLDEVQLSISDTSPLMVTAEQSAVASAKAQAEQLAAAAGEQLGPLVSLTDAPQEANGIYPQAFAASGSSSAGASAPPVPVQPGTQQMSVDVTGVWAVTAG
jgi:uncharacterized protein